MSLSIVSCFYIRLALVFLHIHAANECVVVVGICLRIIGEQGNQMILAFLIASCCTGVIFFTLLFRTLLRITVCSDVSDEEEERKIC